ncbi:MAG: 2OG-Fe(II) oxygenase [Gammaproteobacteria bacterium]
MKLLGPDEFIAYTESLLEPGLCAEIITAFDASDEVCAGKVLYSGSGDDAEHVQNKDKISYDLEIVADGYWGDIYSRLHSAVSTALAQYISSLPSLQAFPMECTGYKIQMYPRNEGQFTWHFDSLSPTGQRRIVAMIVYLNDVSTGGETAFYYQQKAIAPKAGDGILFPTAWTHMHCGCIPQSGDKYIISTFFQFRMS